MPGIPAWASATGSELAAPSPVTFLQALPAGMKDGLDVARWAGLLPGMVPNPDPSEAPPFVSAAAARAERLALALRENLRRRKAQARARASQTSPSENGDADTAPEKSDAPCR